MHRLIVAALLMSAAPLAAAEITAQSRIDGVVVYPGVAAVTRVLEVQIPAGQHTLVVPGLPQSLDPHSIRIEGEGTGGLAIGSVELRAQPLGGVQEPSGEVAQRLKALQLDRQKSQAALQALQSKQRMIQAIADQAPAVIGGKERPLDPAEWPRAWGAVGEGLKEVAAELVAAQAELRRIEEEIRALTVHGVQGGRAAAVRAAHVAVEAAADGKARLRLAYQVPGVTWRPGYDARLAVGRAGEKPVLTLVRRAIVSQQTGEDWTDVTLAVSTAQARGGTAAPDVPPVRVAFNEPPVVIQSSAAMRSRASVAPGAPPPAEAMAAPPADAPRPAPVVEAGAEVRIAGFAAQFVVPGRVTITADGATRSFRLGAREIEPSLGVRAAPGLDPKAYLEARFTHEEEAPLLPGEASLTRDGVFVGQGRIGQTAPGETVELGFGVDDRVKVTRAPVRRRETEPGWVQGSRTDLREFRTVVKNLHDRPMRITILDQTPFSENAAITVEALPNMTAPTERNVKDRRGVVAWTYDYKPSEEREIRHGFRLRWPGDRELTLAPEGVPQPVPLPAPR